MATRMDLISDPRARLRRIAEVRATLDVNNPEWLAKNLPDGFTVSTFREYLLERDYASKEPLYYQEKMAQQDLTQMEHDEKAAAAEDAAAKAAAAGAAALDAVAMKAAADHAAAAEAVAAEVAASEAAAVKAAAAAAAVTGAAQLPACIHGDALAGFEQAGGWVKCHECCRHGEWKVQPNGDRWFDRA